MVAKLAAKNKTFKSRRWELIAKLGAVCESKGVWRVGIYDLIRDSHGAWSVMEWREECLITHAIRTDLTEALEYVAAGKESVPGTDPH